MISGYPILRNICEEERGWLIWCAKRTDSNYAISPWPYSRGITVIMIFSRNLFFLQKYKQSILFGTSRRLVVFLYCGVHFKWLMTGRVYVLQKYINIRIFMLNMRSNEESENLFLWCFYQIRSANNLQVLIFVFFIFLVYCILNV